MATGREARAERLNERLRGAQRVNVADDSFNLDLAGISVAPPQSSPSRTEEPSSAAKRRKLDNGAPAPAPTEQRSATRRSPRSRDPYRLPDTSNESVGQADTTARTRRQITPQEGGPRSATRTARSSKPTSAPPQDALEPDDLESLPPPSSVRSATRPRSSGRIEEIEESPPKAPGSGQRRSVQVSSAVASSARLQGTLQSDENAPMSSSPLTRKSRMSDAAASARSTRTARTVRQTPSRSPLAEEVDELSPDRPPEPEVADDELSETEVPVVEEEAEAVEEVGQLDEAPQSDELGEADEAEEIGAAEAAAALGKKRQRRNMRAASPQLGSNDRENEPASAPRRKPGRPSRSPATQKQGGPTTKPAAQKRALQPKAKEQSKVKPKTKTKARTSPKQKQRRTSEENNTAIELTVQRFVNHKRRGEDGEEGDPLQLDIPFANRTGESAVDVFAQVCDEVIGNTVAQFQEIVDNAPDAARKKEFRIKIRAVEAYREILNSRLLQHAIHLNHWHSLRKRVRHAQKEKLALREEILRLKAEREQVALRMDAVRIKHEADTEESAFLLNTSSTMRDIDLAVTQGREAAELPPKAQKEAELANLELIVSQVSDQVSSVGPTGGLLNQIRDFNAFLERAAVAFESR